jgi:hypothetical protein
MRPFPLFAIRLYNIRKSAMITEKGFVWAMIVRGGVIGIAFISFFFR